MQEELMYPIPTVQYSISPLGKGIKGVELPRVTQNLWVCPTYSPLLHLFPIQLTCMGWTAATGGPVVADLSAAAAEDVVKGHTDRMSKQNGRTRQEKPQICGQTVYTGWPWGSATTFCWLFLKFHNVAQLLCNSYPMRRETASTLKNATNIYMP